MERLPSTTSGADGNLIGTPVLNQPEVGILGVGTIVKRVVVVSQGSEDALAIRWMGYLCLSYDHRAEVPPSSSQY